MQKTRHCTAASRADLRSLKLSAAIICLLVFAVPQVFGSSLIEESERFRNSISTIVGESLEPETQMAHRLIWEVMLAQQNGGTNALTVADLKDIGFTVPDALTRNPVVMSAQSAWVTNPRSGLVELWPEDSVIRNFGPGEIPDDFKGLYQRARELFPGTEIVSCTIADLSVTDALGQRIRVALMFFVEGSGMYRYVEGISFHLQEGQGVPISSAGEARDMINEAFPGWDGAIPAGQTDAQSDDVFAGEERSGFGANRLVVPLVAAILVAGGIFLFLRAGAS